MLVGFKAFRLLSIWSLAALLKNGKFWGNSISRTERGTLAGGKTLYKTVREAAPITHNIRKDCGLAACLETENFLNFLFSLK